MFGSKVMFRRLDISGSLPLRHSGNGPFAIICIAYQGIVAECPSSATGSRDATTATATLPPGSLQRMVRHRRHTTKISTKASEHPSATKATMAAQPNESLRHRQQCVHSVRVPSERASILVRRPGLNTGSGLDTTKSMARLAM